MIDSLTLRVDHNDEVSLPVDLLNTQLSLAEIGALVLLLAMAEDKVGFDHPRFTNDDSKAPVRALNEKGIFVVGQSKNGGITLRIDLDKACSS